nr:MAG TPA: hypothetical protein [Caudoviricetes sp.]
MKNYKVSFTKTGKQWKKQLKGTEFMLDDDLYRLDLEIEGLKNTIKCWWRILTNKPNHGTFVK